MEEKKNSFVKSNAYNLYVRMRDMIAAGHIKIEVADKVTDILNGKSVIEGVQPMAPGSQEAKNLANQVAWCEQYKDNPRFSEQNKKTPLEKLLEKY